MTLETSLLLLTWVAILILGLAVVGLVRQIGEIVGNDPEQSAGRVAADFALPPELTAIRNTLPDSFAVVCVTDTCAACHERLAELAAVAGPPVVVISSAHLDPVRDIPDTVLTHIVTEQAFEEFGVHVTPFAAVIRGDSIEQTGALGSAESLKMLLHSVNPIDLTTERTLETGAEQR